MNTRASSQQSVESVPSAQALIDRYERQSVAEHPLFVELSARPVDLSALWLLMENLREGVSQEFVVWLAQTIARVDDRRIGSLVAKQLDDELGSGDFTRIHSHLLDRLVDGLSPWRIEERSARLLSPGKLLRQEARAPFYAEHPYECVGALISGEIFAKKMDHCLGDQVRRQDQLPEACLIWLTIHETLEEDHADDSGKLAELIPREGAALTATVRGAEAQWSSLWRFLDRIHQLRRELNNVSTMS